MLPRQGFKDLILIGPALSYQDVTKRGILMSLQDQCSQQVGVSDCPCINKMMAKRQPCSRGFPSQSGIEQNYRLIPHHTTTCPWTLGQPERRWVNSQLTMVGNWLSFTLGLRVDRFMGLHGLGKAFE